MSYTYHPKTILRTPLKPLKTSFSKQELQQLFVQKEVQEALFLASPNLLTECKKWLNHEITDKTEEEKLTYSLLKYALRMHSRCTPYGLFAGCGIIENSSDTITINTKKVERSTRLDMNFTCALAQELVKLPFIQPYLKFYPNTSIYNLQHKIRYVEYYYNNKRRIHQISAVDNSSYVQTLLQKAQQGATLNALAQSITNKEITTAEALEFLQEIVAAQLVVSELEPAVTGDEPLTQIINCLLHLSPLEKPVPIFREGLRGVSMIDTKNQELQNIIFLLQNTQTQLTNIDQKIGNEILIYEDLAENLKQLNIPFELSKLFQTDMFLNISPSRHSCGVQRKQESDKNNGQISDNFSATLQNFRNDDKVQDQLTNAITILNQLTSKPAKTNLSEFQKMFYERYEDKEVSLLEVLDIETGVGYAQNTNHTGDVNPLVNDIMLPYDNNQDTELNWSKKQSFLFRKLLIAKQNNERVIQLTSKDVAAFKVNWEDLPDSFSVMYKHLGKREEKDLLSIDNVGGSSATYLLGRFASSNKEIAELVTEIADTEQRNNPDVIFAEIAHLPESRTGNILMRPAFRQYEIPYLSNSTLPEEQQIPLSDLSLSVKYNQLMLRSKRLNKQIIPRLGNAHNYSFNALPVYHFLCDLQTQNLRGGLYFDWGAIKNEFSFLPRVEVENVIISSATWQLKKEQFQELLDKKEPILILSKKWQKKWQLPDLVLLADRDNELLINLKNELSLKMFVAEIKKRPAITLKEFLFDEKTAAVRDEQGNAYTNEFIAILQKEPTINPIRHSLRSDSVDKESSQNNEQIPDNFSATLQNFRNDETNEKTLSVASLPFGEVRRSFSLGSEWLYYKIYCGVKTADRILTEVIKPLTETLIEQQLIDSWFFIRYADPDVHLRVRFHFTDLNHIGTVIQLFKNAIAEYEQTGLIWKIQTDTYQREMERYGTNTMMLSEQLFYYDSQCIVDMLDRIDGDEGEEIRWLFAIKAVDVLLSDFNYSMEQKRELVENLKIGFAHEFNMNKDLKMQMDKKFRIHREAITKVLNAENDETGQLQPLFELLKQKSESIKPLVTEILTIQQNNQLQLHINDLMASYIHMLLNRLFKNKQRMHEMVIYDFIWRTYRSQIAIQQQKQLVNS